MNHDKIRLILFHIFPKGIVIQDATGWDHKDVKDEIIAEKPVFERRETSIFSTKDERDAVKAVYNALHLISRRSLDEKSDECSRLDRSKVIGEAGLVPLSLNFDDYAFWARKRRWLPSEAILLSLGLIPHPTTIKEFDTVVETKFGFCRLLKEYKERQILLEDAISSARLKADFAPIDFIDWINENEFAFPDGLPEAVHRYQVVQICAPHVKKTDTLSAIEKQTLLKLIAGMSIGGYKFDPDSPRNAATKDIKGDLELLGIALDSNTILKWLRIAAKVPKDDPEEDL